MSSESVYLLVTVVVVICAAILVLALPEFVRGYRLRSLAKQYGLSYIRSTKHGRDARTFLQKIDRSVMWKEHIMRGVVRTHEVEVYDSCTLTRGLSSTPSVRYETVILVDGVRQQITTRWFSKKASVSRIRAFLQSLDSLA